MDALPAGTVTFLFTDIEGSTKLWEQFPEGMQTAMAKHDALLAQCVAAHGGKIVKTTGDGIHAVFGTAAQGVAAALSAQRALYEQRWEDIAPRVLRARMGLHTGEAEMRAGDYYGGTLNRAARLMAVAHGGQILLSGTTAELVRDGLPEEVGFRDLGEHRLKDLTRPEHLFQLVHPELPANFPALATFDTIPNNLPVQLTSFIGREKEIAEVRGLLAEGRLVTLTGSGGTGKTRLAQEIGALELSHFPDGVWLMELASLTGAAQIIPAMAQVFGLPEIMFEPLPTIVTDYLREKQALLILDNCEHLIEGCARLADDLLRQCAKLKMVASSREALGIAGEVAYQVPSLAVEESRQLFLERARAANPRFHQTDGSAQAVDTICARLDGIPLAIELAAARVRLLSPEQIAARLNDRFRLLVGGSRTALPRQQTLRALIDWSYDLLSEAEQRLLRAASVFTGGWTLEALEAVANAPDALETLEQLINKSLVTTEERGAEMRYALLETIRQYAREKLLDAGEAVGARERHFDYYDRFAERSWHALRSADAAAWLDHIDDETENFRAALDWGLEQRPEDALQTAANASMVLAWRGYMPEARVWIDTALNRADELPPVTGERLAERKRIRARALWARAFTNIGQGDTARGAEELATAATLAREVDDAFTLGNTLEMYFMASRFLGHSDEADRAAEEGLAILLKVGDSWGITQGYLNMARIALERGNAEQWNAYMQKAGQTGASPLMGAYSYLNLGMTERFVGHLEPARTHFEKGLVLFRQLRNRSMENVMLSELGHVARQSGDLQGAIEIYRQTLPRWQEFGSRAAVAHQLECFAFLCAAWNQPERAAKLLGAAEALRETSGGAMAIYERGEYAREVEQLRGMLDGAAFDAAWAEGRHMTMDQAVRFALEEKS